MPAVVCGAPRCLAVPDGALFLRSLLTIHSQYYNHTFSILQPYILNIITMSKGLPSSPKRVIQSNTYDAVYQPVTARTTPSMLCYNPKSPILRHSTYSSSDA